jgi:hypothetical protein
LKIVVNEGTAAGKNQCCGARNFSKKFLHSVNYSVAIFSGTT